MIGGTPCKTVIMLLNDLEHTIKNAVRIPKLIGKIHEIEDQKEEI